MVKLFGMEFGRKATVTEDVPVISVKDLPVATMVSPWEDSTYDGNKFFGGFGVTQVQYNDYWTLRARSEQLFNENLYAAGIIRRLITNEINTGLTPEAQPDADIVGVSEDTLNDWSEGVETRFGIWGKSPLVCAWDHVSTFGALQRAAREEALISGDALVVLRIHQKTGMPTVQIVRGSAVQTPLIGENAKVGKKKIKHGVELGPQNRHVAFWVRQEDGSTKRIPAWGEKSGRRVAWLVYGTDKRFDDLRGRPMLSLVLQGLKELDRYRDSTLRKVVVNSMLAMFIKKDADKIGSLPIQGGATRKDTVQIADSDGGQRKFNIASMIPGMVIEELNEGEEPKLMGGEGTDTNYGEFETAVIQTAAWANEIPPEILTLAFSNNYSASQAAINEFKIYLNKIWSSWGESFCTPIYLEFLVSNVLLGKIDAPGLLSAWRDISQYEIFGSWVTVDWYGSIKPSTDMVKQGKASKQLIDEGWSNNARESRMLTGTKFSKNIKRIKRENELKIEAATPLAEFAQKYKNDPSALINKEI